MLEVLKIFGFSLLGLLLYAVFQVWIKIRQDGFDPNKFFKHNQRFWATGIILLSLLTILVKLVPDIDTVISLLGFNIKNTPSGWVLLGFAIGGGNDKSKLSGDKNFNSSSSKKIN